MVEKQEYEVTAARNVVIDALIDAVDAEITETERAAGYDVEEEDNGEHEAENGSKEEEQSEGTVG